MKSPSYTGANFTNSSATVNCKRCGKSTLLVQLVANKKWFTVDVVKEYDATIHNELDMRMEAANAAQMKRNFDGSDLIYVPEIYWDYTDEKVLVMERIHGTPIREVEILAEMGIDMRKLAHDGVTIFFTQAFPL